MFFDNWDNVMRVVVIGSLAYAGLLVLLRISGNRTLSKMNSFDLVVTIAFGSILSTILMDRNIALAEGLTAIALLVFLQFAVTWLSVRSGLVSNVVKTRPTVLMLDGQFLHDAMKLVRVTENEICAAVRQCGIGGVEQVAVVIMEADGSLSVIKVQSRGSGDAIRGVRRID